MLTVSDLLLLADQALRDPNAFSPTGDSDIENGLDAINMGFDACASVVPCP